MYLPLVWLYNFSKLSIVWQRYKNNIRIILTSPRISWSILWLRQNSCCPRIKPTHLWLLTRSMYTRSSLSTCPVFIRPVSCVVSDVVYHVSSGTKNSMVSYYWFAYILNYSFRIQDALITILYSFNTFCYCIWCARTKFPIIIVVEAACDCAMNCVGVSQITDNQLSKGIKYGKLPDMLFCICTSVRPIHGQ